MLEYFRKNVGGLLGLLIIGLLVLAFVLTFGSQSQGWGQGATVSTSITVDGAEIPDTVFRYAMNLSSQDNISPESAEYAALRQTVARGLIERQILLNLAATSGISASNDEATDNILKGDFYITRSISSLLEQLSFQVQFGRIPVSALPSIVIREGHRAPMQSFKGQDDKFDVEMFNKYIRYRLQTKEEDFVEQQRLEIIALRMRQLLVSGIAVSDAELRAVYDRENDTATVSFLRFSSDVFAQRHQVTEEEKTVWIAANAEAVGRYFETNKYQYTGLEKMVRARHILTKVDSDASEEEKAAARNRAQGLLAEVRRPGADFETLAKLNSQDPGSAVKGGDLGFNPKGKMVPAFDEVMFAMAPGQISDLVETEFGFHVIQIVAIREGDVSLADATSEIADKLIAEEYGARMAREKADATLQALKSGTSIEQVVPAESEDGVAEHLRLMVQTSGVFSPSSANVPGIGEARKLVTAVFGLAEGSVLVDEVIDVDGTLYVAVLKERVRPGDEGFKAKKEEIRERMAAMKQTSWLKDRMAAMMEELMKAGRIKADFPLDFGSAKPEPPPSVRPASPVAPAPVSAPEPASAEAEDNDGGAE